MIIHPIEPVYDKNSRILVLGSFPSVKSREEGFFYGHPQNRFWRVMASVLDAPTPSTIEEKRDLLIENNIALWDVIHSCEIKGSSDSSIENVTANDLREIISRGNIRAIYCNGSTAYSLFEKYIKPTLENFGLVNPNAILLPSTSPANAAWSLDALVNVWKRILIGLAISDPTADFYSLNSFAMDIASSGWANKYYFRKNADEISHSPIPEKLYRLSIDGEFTCPNRDGTLGNSGCIFCSGGGSGDFAGNRNLSVTAQLSEQKLLIKNKLPKTKTIGYIAYFQAFTNTYDSPERLRSLYMEAISDPEVYVLSIATRPDCLGVEILELLREINAIKPVWIELGLQTTSAASAKYIRRGYDLRVYDKAVVDLKKIGISQIITHVILGLPNESVSQMKKTVAHAAKIGSTGIKLSMLHILRGTDLADEYQNGKVKVLSRNEYTCLLPEVFSLLPPDMVVHRFTGDGSKRDLIAPLWSADKKAVINAISAVLSARRL